LSACIEAWDAQFPAHQRRRDYQLRWFEPTGAARRSGWKVSVNQDEKRSLAS
jgi:hypothetical protein